MLVLLLALVGGAACTLPVTSVADVPASPELIAAAGCAGHKLPAAVLPLPVNPTAAATITVVGRDLQTPLGATPAATLGAEHDPANTLTAPSCVSSVGAGITATGVNANTYTFTLPTGGAGNALCTSSTTAACETNAATWNKLNGRYRPLCLDGQFAGVWVVGQYSCLDGTPGSLCSDRTSPAHSQLEAMYSTDAKKAVANAETSCQASTTGLKLGSCYNPNESTMKLCGGRVYDSREYHCCAGSEIMPLNCGASSRCTCRQQPKYDSTTAGNVACPTGSTCCVASKYSYAESVLVAGTCVVNDGFEKCCDTGAVYNTKTEQCCVVTGVQAISAGGCPCETDNECAEPASEGTYTRKTCCKQTAPVPTSTAHCSKYTNFPTGTIDAGSVRCHGRCIDPTYEICCNGAACAKEFQKCCNDTCYNVFTESCSLGRKDVANPFNNWEYGVWYDMKTEIESMNLIRAWWVFLLPTMCLLCAFGALAIALVFASHARIAFAWVEKVTCVLAVLGCLSCVPLFFSPAYKYGIAATLANVFLILNATGRVRWVSISACVVTLVTLGYLVDPFLGSDYLTLASDRDPSGRARADTGGVFHAVGSSFPSVANYDPASNYCLDFYNGYFQYDPMLLDTQRIDNSARQSFGYCSREWTVAVLVFSGALMVIMLVQFIVALLTLLMRFRDADKNDNAYSVFHNE